MTINMILAGVGGQGILTIAQAISQAAMRKGWFVKQAEVHGMAQRGGSVYSHLRLSTEELYSDLIPRGECDILVSMEPLETLRYLSLLRPSGCIVGSTVPQPNIPNYPPLEEILSPITGFGDHVLVDMDRLARAAGSGLSGNAVMLGATSWRLGWEVAELEQSLRGLFERKGTRLVETNLRAFRLGRHAAYLFADGLQRGWPPRRVHEWVTKLTPERLADAVEDPREFFRSSARDRSAEPLDGRTAPRPPTDGFMFPDGCGPTDVTVTDVPCEDDLSTAEERAVAHMLLDVHRDGRRQLFEHEVYCLVELVGAIPPPPHLYLPAGSMVSDSLLQRFAEDRVVLKLVSEEVVHKTEAQAVQFVSKDAAMVNEAIRTMVERHTRAGVRVAGVLLVEYVPHDRSTFGAELFVGVRASREFGPVIAAGLGGVDTEYLSSRMRPGLAAAKALAFDTTAEQFLDEFRKTVAYDVLSGRARGHQRVVSDGALLRCFRAFLGISRKFCVDRGDEGPDLGELEVNPFAFVRQRMIPLDGRGRLRTATRKPPPRPARQVDVLLEPATITVVGASADRENFGRIILSNIRACGFPTERLFVLRKDGRSVDGVQPLADLGSAPATIDLMVVASGSQGVPELVQDAVDSGKVRSIILIPGAMGETQSSSEVPARIRSTLAAARTRPDGGPVVLGGNCLGIRSRPGRYDTFFVPERKLNPRRDQPEHPTALITQSGAFAITRISNMESVNPTITVTIGNQIDLTVADVFQAVSRRDDVKVIGVYMEGFNDLDGLAFVRAVKEVSLPGPGSKSVIFYKAGRTPTGQSATAGHTASVAGDYEMCQAALAGAGAVVVDTFKEFEQLVELATAFRALPVSGRRIGVISNAGFEVVGMADASMGVRYRLEIPPLSSETTAAMNRVFQSRGLESLVTPRNPLDLNPMADEDVYEHCSRAMLADPSIDALVISIVPFTPALRTTPEELEAGESLVDRLPGLVDEYQKPLVIVVDAGRPYDELSLRFQRAGLPVFPSCDQAIRSLGRYLCHRASKSSPSKPPAAPAIGATHQGVMIATT